MDAVYMSEEGPVPGFDSFDEHWLASLRWEYLDASDGLSRWRVSSAEGLRRWLLVRADHPATPAALAWLDREYALAPCLDAAWALRPLGRLATREGPGLVLQDRGQPACALAGSLSVEAFLSLAINASAALASAHERGITHHHLCPRHLIVASDGRVRLTGFGAASQMDDTAAAPSGPLPSRYAYLAPEAHMLGSEPMDHIASASPGMDLYALGVTFFELLTGRLPFEANDLLEWHQQHLAVTPPRLGEFRQGLPEALEDLITRLLSKQPEHRPASARLLEAQLWRFLNEWREYGTLQPSAEAFHPPTPARLVGREAPMAILTQAVQALQLGRGGAVFISGEAGIGKTSLVRALRQRLGPHAPLIANAKCELARHPLPYAALCAALSALFTRLASAPPDHAQPIAERVRQALGDQGDTLTRLVPELQWLTGVLPTAREPSVSEARRNLLGLFQRLLAAVATPQHPVMVFLDDLQWVDQETVSFLAELGGRDLRHVLLIVACRNDALETDPALISLLEHFHTLGERCREIALCALDVDDIATVLDARLTLHSAERDALADRLHQRGAGNPLYIDQVIAVLGDAERPGQAVHLPLFADVEALFTTRLDGLPERTREVLRVLAMLGNHTPVGDLAAVTATEPAQLCGLLRPAISAGLLTESRGGLAFIHDSMLEAVRARLPLATQQAMHLQFAAILLGRLPAQADAQALFRVAGQLLRVDHHWLGNGQRQAFVALLARAAETARAAAAPKIALGYLAQAQRMLAGAWPELRSLAQTVALLHAQCLILDADYVAAERHIAKLLQQPLDATERASLYRLGSEIRALQGDYPGAVQTVVGGLASLGISVALNPTAAEADHAWAALLEELAGRAPTVFLTLRPAADPPMEAVADLLASLLIPGSFISPTLMLVTACQIARLTLAHGLTAASVPGLAWLGVTCAHRFDAHVLGFGLSHCAAALAEQPRYASGRVAALVALDQVSVWTQPLPFALECAEQAYRLSLAQGSPSLACFANNHIVSDLLVIGAPIERMLRQIDTGLNLAKNLEYTDAQSILHTQALYIRRLAGDVGGSVPIPARAELARRVGASNMGPLHFWWELFDGLFEFLEGNFEAAAYRMDAAWALAWAVPAHIHLIDLALFTVLNRAALQTATGAAQNFDCPLGRLRLWASLNPRYFADRLALAEAEVCRVRGDHLGALQGYEAAIAHATQCGAIHIQGLGHELAARCHHSAGLAVSARHHWRLARDAWVRWGAGVLARQLEAEHPFLLEPDRFAFSHPAQPSAQPLDVMSITRACQALSREIELDALVKNLLSTTVMYAGATDAALLLVEEDDLMVRATAHASLAGVDVQLCQVQPSPAGLPLSLIHASLRGRASLVVNRPEQLRGYADDSYLRRLENGSAVCVPLLKQNTVIGVLYLENSLAPEVFEPGRVEVLEWLAAQAAISLSHARLYSSLIDENQRRRETETALRAARGELNRTAQATILGELAASIAHEINQPLLSILTNAGASLRWLQRPQPEIGEASEGLRDIKSEAQRAADIVTAIRSLARQAPPERGPVALDDLIRQVLAVTQAEIEDRQVTPVLRLSAPALVEADPVQVQQVVLNLLNNAMDAMQALPAPRRRLTVSTEPVPGGVLTMVEDSGPGIAPEHADKVFQAFYSTKASGMGMGLAICSSIIKAHGGTLHTHTGRQGEHLFLFTLPAAASEEGRGIE